MYLRCVYQNVRADTQSLYAEQSLAMPIKAVNETAGPNDLVVTMLFFDVMPRTPIRPQKLPEQMMRMRCMCVAWD